MTSILSKCLFSQVAEITWPLRHPFKSCFRTRSQWGYNFGHFLRCQESCEALLTLWPPSWQPPGIGKNGANPCRREVDGDRDACCWWFSSFLWLEFPHQPHGCFSKPPLLREFLETLYWKQQTWGKNLPRIPASLGWPLLQRHGQWKPQEAGTESRYDHSIAIFKRFKWERSFNWTLSSFSQKESKVFVPHPNIF